MKSKLIPLALNELLGGAIEKPSSGDALELYYAEGFDSYFRNSFTVMKDDASGGLVTFLADERTVIAHIDGYAIVPIEEHFALKGWALLEKSCLD